MFQFPGFPTSCYLIHITLHGSSPCVFPHSEIHGSKDICSSPWLIAACHVLHRLPMPRHSPYALLRLNYLKYMTSYTPGSRYQYAWIAVFHTCSFWQNCFAIVRLRFYPFSTEKPFRFLVLVFSLYFVCHVFHTNSFELIWYLSFIRFSMNIA